jgi:hypothetical protein
VMLRWAAEHSYIVGSSPVGEPGTTPASAPATTDPREGHV